MVLAGCAADNLVPDQPKVAMDFAINPYEIHEICTQLEVGDRLDFRFEAKAPVKFHLYYNEGLTFLSPVSREDVTEFAGVFLATSARRYCLQWEAGQKGALVDYRVRLRRTAGSS